MVIQIDSPIAYIAQALGYTILLRTIFVWLRVMEYNYREGFESRKLREFKAKPFMERYGLTFWSKSEEPFPDMFYNTVIGFIELCIFPILFANEMHSAIGAWLVFKTVGAWNAWKVDRLAYNRFILANSLQLIISYALLMPFVR